MRKGATVQTLSADMLMDRRNVVLGALNCSLICLLKLKYNGTFTQDKQYVNLNANLNPKRVFSVTIQE